MDFIRSDSCRVGCHLVLGFRLFVRCRLVAVWWMANKRSICFIIAFHNFATLELAYLSMPKFLAGCHYDEEEISQHLKIKLKNRILAGPN